MKFIILAVCLFGTVFATPIEPMVGGWSSVSVDDPTVTQLTAKGVEHHNKNADSLYYNKLIFIIEAKMQVVSGFNYEVKFLIDKTDCVKSYAYAASCQVSFAGIPEFCTYNFWVRPWLGPEQIIQASCVPANK